MIKYEEKTFKTTDGLNLYYRDYGSPDPNADYMICMPGLTRNSRDFSHVAEQLADRFHVICVEQRGRGNSDYDPKPERYVPPTYVMDMFTLLEHLGAERFHALGVSLGGLMTVMMQAMRPGCVISAIINDVGPEVDPRGIERIRGYVSIAGVAKTWDDARAQIKATAHDVYPDFDEADWDDFTRRIFIERDGKLRLDYDPALGQTFTNADPDAAAPDLWPVFQLMAPVPMLVLRGENSDILAVETLERMVREHPDLEAVTVPRVGHAPTMMEDVSVAALEAWANRFGVQTT